ncbi:hypothetical protein TVAG_053150 [Trichomonas vaginalis G3]|uniref:Mannosyltransferase n=2 Tax=Trichomonas vaginalis (strain ATCC PRA-98 / G3) TaxID=412133 RepID=A2GP37_TRIV3|nr:hypothetical protein TVAGG3_0589770 [Trichomonas vaginalis G3]EAX81080.1 hypothetical protein TVAG_053150 [Trichomonas vaginalis G3]KAI5523168.1 hypothetical protein TVAGG3_0589770 [Trichomonas vaginalis G3]|eukprot:XP_001294010.1 hypothetical protein [Trichomonas vaginalis G3]
MLSHVFVWSIFGIVANVLCVPQFTPYLKRLTVKESDGGSGFLVLDPIWNSENRKREWSMAIKLWWRGLGLFAFVSLISCWSVLSKEQKIDYIPSIVVFILTNIIRYQPWELDNTKVFYAAWIPFAIHCYGLFIAKLLRHKTWRVIGVIILFFSCLSAIRLYVLEMSTSTPMFEDDAVEFGKWVSENTPTDAIWLTDQWHSNPVLTMAGRQSYMGYGGWLLSHGLDYFGRDRDSNYMMEHPEDSDFFIKRNITYAVSYQKAFKNWANITSDNGWVKIYEYERFECWKYIPNSTQI